MKKIFVIFTVSFALNLLWENLHSLLYDNYMGGEITEFILLRATLADAVMISVLSLPFLFKPFFKRRAWIIIIAGFVLAVGIEWYALSTHRWAYNALMPIIPVLGVGITPAIQLGLLGYMSLKIHEYVLRTQ